MYRMVRSAFAATFGALVGALLATCALAQSPTAIGPTGQSSGGIGSCTGCRTAAAASSLVFAARGLNVYSVGITNGATAGFLLAYDLAAAPSDGTVTPNYCLAVPSGPGSFSLNWAPGPAWRTFQGLSLVFSTGVDCYTQTSSSTHVFLWFTGQ